MKQWKSLDIVYNCICNNEVGFYMELSIIKRLLEQYKSKIISQEN